MFLLLAGMRRCNTIRMHSSSRTGFALFYNSNEFVRDEFNLAVLE